MFLYAVQGGSNVIFMWGWSRKAKKFKFCSNFTVMFSKTVNGSNGKVITCISRLQMVGCMHVYTHLKKRCRVKIINDGQCDSMELWEDGRGKFVTRFRL